MINTRICQKTAPAFSIQSENKTGKMIGKTISQKAGVRSQETGDRRKDKITRKIGTLGLVLRSLIDNNGELHDW